MLSRLPNSKSSNDEHSTTTNGNFAGSMSALLFDNLFEIMDVDQNLVTTTSYLEECVDPNFATTTPSTSASPFSEHTTLSRTSSDEGSSSNVTTSYTSCTHLDPGLHDNIKKIDLLPEEENIEIEDFPYEDVLALENALEEAIGDSLQNIQETSDKYDEVKTSSDVMEQNSWHMLDNTQKDLSNASQGTVLPIPPIANIFPKITHRVVISPTTTLVLSDDLKQKKERLVATNSNTNTLTNTCKGVKVSNSNTRKKSALGSPQSYTSDSQNCPKSSPLCNDGRINHIECTTNKEMKSKDNNTSSIYESDATISDSSTTQDQAALTKRPAQLMPKQPLPPEGYKITRYPLRRPNLANTTDENDSDSIDLIAELRHELRKAKLEISRSLREMQNWKSTAQHTFEAARKIRAQMELEKSRADRAEYRIFQISSHFRSKAAAKVKAKSFGLEKPSCSTTPNTNNESPGTESQKTNKISDVPIILSRKRRRTVPELDAVTKSLASWLMSSKHIENDGNKKSTTPPMSRSVSESVFGTTRQKEALVYKPQINSGVRLALRAKVCSAKADTLNTAHDLMEQTKLLLAGLPIIPEYSKESFDATPEPPQNKIRKQNRWGSVDDVFKTESTAKLKAPDEVANTIMSYSLSESNLSSKELESKI